MNSSLTSHQHTNNKVSHRDRTLVERLIQGRGRGMGGGVNSSVTSHQQQGHAETRPWLKGSSKRPDLGGGIYLAVPGLEV